MSFQENVAPGTVNNLISFFENQGDESPQTTRGDSTEYKQQVISSYFSESGQEHYADSQSVDTISVEKVQQDFRANGHVNGNDLEGYEFSLRNCSQIEETSAQNVVSKNEEGQTVEVAYRTQSSEDEERVSNEEFREEEIKRRAEEYEAELSYELKYNKIDTTNNTEFEISQHSEQHSTYEHSEQRSEITEISQEESEHQIGFVYPKSDELKEEKQTVDEQNYLMKYELLPDHLKGFTTPTVFPASYFDPEDDAIALKKAMKGLGVDEAKIIDILAYRNADQRQQISRHYEKLYQKSLVQELQKELSGHFEDVVVGLMTPLYEFLAKELKRAVKGAGTNEDTLIEILCTYDDGDITQIKEVYKRLFKNGLKDDIYSDTSGDFRKILLSLLSASREDPNASPPSVASQLSLTNAKGKPSVDADTLRTVLVSYTRPFLYNVFKDYEATTEKPFKDLIKTVTSGDARNALMAIYRGIVSLPIFYAEELRESFKGIGTKDTKLVRIIVSRAEIDLEDIKNEFLYLYETPLEKEVQKETSGDYKKILVALVQGCNRNESNQSAQVPESNL